jgi:predicted metalloprotease with PDZ domain
MPAWCPGSYLIRDYARMVRHLVAVDSTGLALAVRKTDKHTWEIDNPASGQIAVSYQVYGYDLTVRTNHIDDQHAFLHGPATFVYCPPLRTFPATVALTAPEGWQLFSGLRFGHVPLCTLESGLQATSIDELFDMPIALSQPGSTQRHLLPCSTPIELVMWHPRGAHQSGGILPGPFDDERLVKDLAIIVQDHIDRVGEVPFTHYSFLLMLSHDAYGGLEHRNSSVNLYAPNFATSRKNYDGLLELLSHEFFHAWNGKRIAPTPLLDFDYSTEAYTPCLWVMEGVTSHYDRWALATSRCITDKSYLEKLLDDWTRLLSIPGRALQSLEQSSFDAWIKLYKPDESNVNTTVSYYLKGGLSIAALDLEIRRRTFGAKSFDDVLRALWNRYGKIHQPHPDNVQPLFEEACGLDLTEWFVDNVHGTADPRLVQELAHVGVQLVAKADTPADGGSPGWLGVQLGGNKVQSVLDGSPAQLAGISPGDELIAVDGYRVSSDADVRTQLHSRGAKVEVEVTWFRRHQLMATRVVLCSPPAAKFEMLAATNDAEAAARYQSWLGRRFVDGELLATVVTTTRSA